jgi:L-cysteine:1D-myo-inositol 2-amino-2-deoxy-alpha-D-glucopyranoside ligase
MIIYDTAAQAYQQFNPGPEVSMYVCGITPYDSAHLGHAFTFATYDLLQRRLEDDGHSVTMVRNITDVDEPIYAKAKSLGVDYRDLAAKESAASGEVFNALNLRSPNAEPRASEYIFEMAEQVQHLRDRGFAYPLEADVYFDTSKYPRYGELTTFGESLLQRLAAMRGGDPERPGKRNPLDFMLWKGVTDQQDPAQWDTVHGPGRPGWHIECTTMASALLPTPFDLHGGGGDLVFPHHCSEMAQGYGLGNETVARHWMHVAPLLYGGEKMSKSLGNLVFARDLLEVYEPGAIRLALMNYHHRVGGEWRPELTDNASRLLDDVRAIQNQTSHAAGTILLGEVRQALDEDLDTIRIVKALYDFTQTKERTSYGESGQEVEQALELVALV